jgi:hypothetical protein
VRASRDRAGRNVRREPGAPFPWRVLPIGITIAPIPSRSGTRVMLREHLWGNSGERGIEHRFLALVPKHDGPRLPNQWGPLLFTGQEGARGLGHDRSIDHERTANTVGGLFGESLHHSGTFQGVLFPFRVVCEQTEGARSAHFIRVIWSERRDLNSGPPVPQTRMLAYSC